MKFYSTRNKEHKVNIDIAIASGIAPDGGLYMPETIPEVYSSLPENETSFHAVAFNLIHPYLNGFFSDEEINGIIKSSFTFDVPLVKLHDHIFIAELFHGPTLAFKDFGGQFMANTLSAILTKQNKKGTILVATSGDTGSAVANGFFGKENIDVIILYPKGKVSTLQELQLTTFGKNITAISIEGTFDDCQRLVKTAFTDADITQKINLSSANSINIGRLIPQMTYYGFVSHIFFLQHNTKPNIIVPSGNFGNLTAGLIAQKMGYPIKHFAAATNANDVVPEYFETGKYCPRASVQTLSNAMDVGAPSNMERIEVLYHHNLEKIKTHFNAHSVSDEHTKECMKAVYSKYNYITDPHTAVGIYCAEQFYGSEKNIVMSTAHPAKFKEDVEQILGIKVELPTQLSHLLGKDSENIAMGKDYQEFKSYLIER
jgi:threonine synthase